MNANQQRKVLTEEELQKIETKYTYPNVFTGAMLINPDVSELIASNRALAEENKRLREALEWYAHPDSYEIKADYEDEGMPYVDVIVDGGGRARKALEVPHDPN